MMKKEMENGKSVFFVLSDNGPDFNPGSLLNTLFYYRLFRYLQLDMFCVFTYATYAARYSAYNAYNAIEHLWAPASNALAGVILNKDINTLTVNISQQIISLIPRTVKYNDSIDLTSFLEPSEEQVHI